jgi:hypothetical protein
MQSSVRARLARFVSSLLLAAFAFAVAADPILDAVSPHEDECSICAAVAQGFAPADPGPVLQCAPIEAFAEIVSLPLPLLRAEHPVHFGRGPPVS